MKIPASVGILTYNSAATLTRTLESVKDFDDIIINDGGSTDATLAIARAHGARIISQDPAYKNADGTLNDFSGVRNQCLDVARQDWFLYIDSDETISPGLYEDIARTTSVPVGECDALVYRVPIGILMDGRSIKHSSNYPGYQHRFFNKKSGARFKKPVHERIYFDTKSVCVGTLTHPWYIHTTTEDWINYTRDTARYRRMEAERMRGQSVTAYITRSIPHALRVSASVLAKTLYNRVRYGSRDSLPLAAELGRARAPWLVMREALRHTPSA